MSSQPAVLSLIFSDGTLEKIPHAEFLERVHNRSINGDTLVQDETLTRGERRPFRELRLAAKFGYCSRWPWRGRPKFTPIPPEPDCVCRAPRTARPALESTHFLGPDPTNGRYADVSLLRCRHCERAWLLYQVEFESHTASGRWFLCEVADDDGARIRVSSAVAYIEEAPFFFYGGSWFSSPGEIGYYQVGADL